MSLVASCLVVILSLRSTDATHPPASPGQHIRDLASASERLGLEFAQTALYTAVQQPINAITQLVNHCAHKDVLPELDIIDAPPPAKFGSADWFVQAAGTGVGIIAPFLVTSGITSAIGEGVVAAGFLEDLPLLSDAADAVAETPALASAMPIAKGALDGTIYGMLLQPSQSDQTFWHDRFTNSAINALTFGVQSIGTEMSYAALKQAGVPLETDAISMAARALSNSTSGAVTGLVNAESSSLFNGQGFAKGEDIARDVVTYTFTSAVLSAGLHQDNSGTGLIDPTAGVSKSEHIGPRVRFISPDRYQPTTETRRDDRQQA